MIGGAVPKCPKGETYDRALKNCRPKKSPGRKPSESSKSKSSKSTSIGSKKVDLTLIKKIFFHAGERFKDIRVSIDESNNESDSDSVPLTQEHLDTQVFDGNEVEFIYRYLVDKENKEFNNFNFRIKTGTTLREVLTPLVIWGLSVDTENKYPDTYNRYKFFEGFSPINMGKKIVYEANWGTTYPELWKGILDEVKKEPGPWDDLKQKKAVLLYQKLGGKYVNKKV